MPVDLLPGESKQLDVQLTPVAGAGDLLLDNFYVLTIPVAGEGHWEMHCHVYNPSSQLASGSITVTGELQRAGGDPRFIHPINEVREFTVEPRRMYKLMLHHYQYPHCGETDQCWFKIDTSWGESTRQMWFVAGYKTRPVTTISAYAITGDSAIIRYSAGSATGKEFLYWIRTPPCCPFEQTLDIDCISGGDIYLTCYLYVMRLLSKREYGAECCIRGSDCINTTFWTS